MFKWKWLEKLRKRKKEAKPGTEKVSKKAEVGAKKAKPGAEKVSEKAEVGAKKAKPGAEKVFEGDQKKKNGKSWKIIVAVIAILLVMITLLVLKDRGVILTPKTSSVTTTTLEPALEPEITSKEVEDIVEKVVSAALATFAEEVKTEAIVEEVKTEAIVEEVKTEAIVEEVKTEKIVIDELFTISGAPTIVAPQKIAGNENEQKCSLPGGCDIFGDPGVLSANTWAEADANKSCVWIGGADIQEALENEKSSVLLPEAGYIMASGARMRVAGNNFEVKLEAKANHAWFLVARGLNEGDGDLNTPLTFTEYDPGTLTTRFPIPAHAGGFFSQVYFEQNVKTAHTEKNCGSGGCPEVSTIIFDFNNGAYTVLHHTEENGWTLVETNVK